MKKIFKFLRYSKDSSSTSKPQSNRRKWWIWGGLFFVLGFFLACIISVYVGILGLQTLVQMEELLQDQPWDLPSRVYARPFEIKVGAQFERAELKERFTRLGYYPAINVQASGEYAWDENGLDLYLRDASSPDGMRRGFPVRVEQVDDVVAGVWNLETGKRLSKLTLEPELLGSIYDPSLEDRRPIPLEDVPQQFLDCLLVSEDESFFEHHGVDFLGIMRAVWVNLKRGRYAQGGSTITQQLVRNLFLTRKRTLKRKADEAFMAILLELTRTKEQILELYINECYFGQAGSVSISGLRQGARYYFGTEPRHLNLAQSAMLVALLRGPNYYNPFKYPERLKKRRDFILARLAQEGTINDDQRDEAMAQPLPDIPSSLMGTAPYVVDAVRRKLADTLTFSELQSEGYSIFTTIDAHYQQIAQDALRKGLENLEENYPRLKRSEKPLEGALVSIDPQSGAVLAMASGRDFKTSPYNRVLLAQRPIGSVIKPFLYLYALDGTKQDQFNWRPNSLLTDYPITIQTPSGPWTPQNYDRTYHGEVTLRYALEESLNVPAVRLAQQLGIERVAQFFEKVGISNPPRVPSLVLGTVEMSPIQVAKLYTIFLNEGNRITPQYIQSVLLTDQTRLPISPPESVSVASRISSFQILSILQGVFERGTAHRAHSLGWTGIAAGKTGTTDEKKDAWFVGMTPDLITVVWVGFDQPESTGLTGSTGALPIWVDYMSDIKPNGNQVMFEIPPGVKQIPVSYENGSLNPAEDELVVNEYFPVDHFGADRPHEETRSQDEHQQSNETGVRALPDVDITGQPLESENR